MYYMNHVTKFFFFTDQHFLLVVPLNPKMNRGSTGSGLTTAKRGKNQQAGNFRRLEPTTLVMGTCNSKPELSCCV